MQNNDEFSVQNKLNQYITEDNYGGIEINYSGAIKIITKEHYSRLVNRIKQLQKQCSDLSELNKSYKQQIEVLDHENKCLTSDYQKLGSSYEKMQERYEKFIQRQGKGRPKVLTDEVKKFIQHRHSSQMQIKTIHEELIKKGVSISYETVREYISSSVKAKKWL